MATSYKKLHSLGKCEYWWFHRSFIVASKSLKLSLSYQKKGQQTLKEFVQNFLKGSQYVIKYFCYLIYQYPQNHSMNSIALYHKQKSNLGFE